MDDGAEEHAVSWFWQYGEFGVCVEHFTDWNGSLSPKHVWEMGF